MGQILTDMNDLEKLLAIYLWNILCSGFNIMNVFVYKVELMMMLVKVLARFVVGMELESKIESLVGIVFDFEACGPKYIHNGFTMEPAPTSYRSNARSYLCFPTKVKGLVV